MAGNHKHYVEYIPAAVAAAVGAPAPVVSKAPRSPRIGRAGGVVIRRNSPAVIAAARPIVVDAPSHRHPPGEVVIQRNGPAAVGRAVGPVVQARSTRKPAQIIVVRNAATRATTPQPLVRSVSRRQAGRTIIVHSGATIRSAAPAPVVRAPSRRQAGRLITARNAAPVVVVVTTPAPVPLVTRPQKRRQVVQPIVIRGAQPFVAAARAPTVSRPRRVQPVAPAIIVKGHSTQGSPSPFVSRQVPRRRAVPPIVTRTPAPAAVKAPAPYVVVPRNRPGRPRLIIISNPIAPAPPPGAADSWISINTAGSGVTPPAGSYLRLEVEVA